MGLLNQVQKLLVKFFNPRVIDPANTVKDCLPLLSLMCAVSDNLRLSAESSLKGFCTDLAIITLQEAQLS